jgi:hypothetical protein
MAYSHHSKTTALCTVKKLGIFGSSTAELDFSGDTTPLSALIWDHLLTASVEKTYAFSWKQQRHQYFTTSFEEVLIPYIWIGVGTAMLLGLLALCWSAFATATAAQSDGVTIKDSSNRDQTECRVPVPDELHRLAELQCDVECAEKLLDSLNDDFEGHRVTDIIDDSEYEDDATVRSDVPMRDEGKIQDDVSCSAHDDSESESTLSDFVVDDDDSIASSESYQDSLTSSEDCDDDHVEMGHCSSMLSMPGRGMVWKTTEWGWDRS